MRTLHFHPFAGLNKSELFNHQWLNQELHLPHMLMQPWFWVALIFISLFLITSLLAILGPSSSGFIPPVYYP
jgi:hypothetical protein